ncbi:serine protease 1-like [Physella acuta]|uniref:serine protease 1-like n=1 Tax=Physella acuta TaxID=109671 RepID=UPI0027DEA306|nr:serine protease 1-like [Physella acuta]
MFQLMLGWMMRDVTKPTMMSSTLVSCLIVVTSVLLRGCSAASYHQRLGYQNPDFKMAPSAGTVTCGSRHFDHSDVNRFIDTRSTNDAYPVPAWKSMDHASKIVGGRMAVHGSTPWQAGLHRVYYSPTSTAQFCGGTIISEHWVLTAAHCVEDLQVSQLRLVVGDHSLIKHDEGEQVFRVERILVHGKYDYKTVQNDIALLKVKPVNGRGIRFNDFVQPACLPKINTPYRDGTTCIISGWGDVDRKNMDFWGDGNSPDVLMEAEAPIINDTTCEDVLRRAGALTFRKKSMVCAGHLSGKMDTCQGDSGGPLVCRVDDVYTVLGVTSWGRGCGQPNAPGVYARVKTYSRWIYILIQIYSNNDQQRLIPQRP